MNNWPLGVFLSDTMHGLWECFWVWFCLTLCTDCGCFWVWFCLIQCMDCESVSGCVSVWYNARNVKVFLGVILSDTMHGLCECFWVWFCLIQCTDCESVSGCDSVWYNVICQNQEVLIYIILLPLALQPAVGFGLSNNTSPFVPIYHQLSPIFSLSTL